MFIAQRFAVAGHLYGHSVAVLPREDTLLGRFVTWMGGLSQAAAAGALNFLSGLEESFVKPTELYLALCTVVPESSNTGVTITEATGATGYARIKMTGSIAKAVEGTKSSIKNNAELVGANITAGSATVIGWAACDKKETSKGKVFAWGSCTSTVISSTQTPPVVASEKAVIEIE